jgi:hypothetical protein
VDADRLLGLMGLHNDDSAIERAFVDLRTRRRPELDPDDRDAFYDWICVRKEGVELGFVDETFHRARERWRRRRKGAKLVLFQVYFYTQRDDILTFPGRLPFGLSWADTRDKVRQRLAAHEGARRSYVRDTWTLDNYLITATYKSKTNSLDSIVCQLDHLPWPEEGRMQPAVAIHDWIGLLGSAAQSFALESRLQPLNLARAIADAEDDHEIDFRYECGLELHFTDPADLILTKKGVFPKASQLVLGAVRFFRGRELDARQWTGELPFGLSFDATQEALIAAVGRQPDEQEDDDLDGYAMWHFPNFDLHVLYDNVKNRLLRVTLMAPGFS